MEEGRKVRRKEGGTESREEWKGRREGRNGGRKEENEDKEKFTNSSKVAITLFAPLTTALP